MEKLIEKEKELVKTINHYSNFLKDSGKYEESFLFVKILNKSITLQEKINLQPENLLLLYSTLRYLFETLVHTRLILIEPEYIYKLTYSIHVHQVDKTKRLIDRLNREILIIDKYVILENERLEKISNLAGNKSDEQITKILKELKEEENVLDKEADRELTIFLGDYRFNGFPYQKILMQKNLKILENKLLEYEKLKDKRAKEIVKDSRIKQHFDFANQYTKVFELLKDRRSWGEKAKLGGFENEYIQMYELSSAILHSTSYSLITTLESDDYEKQIVLNLLIKYSKHIVYNIEDVLDVKNLKKVVIIN